MFEGLSWEGVAGKEVAFQVVNQVCPQAADLDAGPRFLLRVTTCQNVGASPGPRGSRGLCVAIPKLGLRTRAGFVAAAQPAGAAIVRGVTAQVSPSRTGSYGSYCTEMRSEDEQARGIGLGEPEVVRVARLVRAGRRHPAMFRRVFGEAAVYCQRPERPGVLIAEVAGGRWVGVFSTLERLGCFAGECDWQAMTGADLLSQLPEGVGVLLDPQDEHVIPVLAATPDE